MDAIRIQCGKCGGKVARIPDVGNPWLDAGIVPYSTVRYNTDRAYWEQWIPADLVLECFPGQFRNWFYALLAMSTMMENKPPFKTLLGHAFIRDEKGDEMSKSGPNAIPFDEGAEKAGADAMRWLFCRQNPVNNLNFGYTLTEQVKRKVFNTWWNVLSFFISYARTDDFDPKSPKLPAAERQDLDRWILSRLQELLTVANDRLAEYDAPALVREAEQFLDALSTWYVRRSRRRFWRPKDPNDRDKLAAYQTLHETLVALCKALAPIVPFITEDFYQRLVRNVDSTAPESVHHCAYPQPDPALHDEALSREMDAAMQMVSAALALREARQLRVRLPLSEIIVVPANQTQANALRRFETHILDELNIKKLTLAKDPSALVTYEVKPNMKLLGPKYGKEAAAIQQLLGRQHPAALARAIEKGLPIRLVARGRAFEILRDEILVAKKEAIGYAVSVSWSSSAGTSKSISAGVSTSIRISGAQSVSASFSTSTSASMMGININVSPELQREGLARDIVRHIQQMRKEADLDLMDHVQVAYETSDEVLRRSIGEHQEYIRGETLCDNLSAAHSESAKEIKLSGRVVRLAVQKVT